MLAQYYEIIEKDASVKYAVDQKLNFIRLKWEIIARTKKNGKGDTFMHYVL